MDRSQMTIARPELAAARHDFIGCAAIKTPPEVFESCLELFDNPAFQRVKMVPSGALKQRVLERTTNDSVREALRPSVEAKVFSSIPQGLSHLMLQHPNEFRQLVEDSRIQDDSVKSIIKSMTPE